MLQSLMEFIVLELRLSAKHLFSPSFKKYNMLVTHSWLKSLWDECSTSSITVLIENIDHAPPWVGNKCLLQAFIDEGFGSQDLVIVNRV